MKSFTVQLLFVLCVLVLQQGFGAGDTSCVNQLSACYQYLNGNEEADVPNTCCDPLKSVVQNEKTCFCTLLSRKESDRAEKAGINVTAAQQLPARCGLRVNPISCLTSSSDSPSPRGSNQDSAAALSLRSVNMMTVMAICMIISDLVVSSSLL